MSIYRGTGGSSTTTDETTINAVNQKAAEAATSATNAASSASSAATSASTANTKASQASTSADSAATSATQASASKDTAVSSATAAQAAQVAAETAQAAAESAETNAVLYGNMANTAAGSATSSATAAASSASAAQSTYADTLALGTTASNAATAAATSATEAESASAQAAGYASDASTSASNAASSANSAATYATSAQAAEASTIALFDQFGDQYLGPKASDPSVDNDGDALTEGDVYWNTTDNVLKFYNGTSWTAPEDVASTAAANALVSETNAATSATSAANYASTASSAAASTAGSVTAAATSATNAANSATAAAASETSAEGHKDLAYTYWQNAASAVTYQDLAAIAETKAVTAVDVFVYDTSKDSDGGAWRKRTQHTSWYNEPLNTSTRGSRKEFPAVAVIVAQSDGITIYDGDDPDLPMWMVFNGNAVFGAGTYNCISALNGVVSVGTNGWGIPTANFIADYGYHQWNHVVQTLNAGGLDQRNTYTGITQIGAPTIVNSYVNDVAMTVLPNAPIDPATQLPIPTIAVATDGGVSVIKDDGSVVDIYNNDNANAANFVGFTTDNLLYCQLYDDNRGLRFFPIPTSDVAQQNHYTQGHAVEWYGDTVYKNGSLFMLGAPTGGAAYKQLAVSFGSKIARGLNVSGTGLSQILRNTTEPDLGMVAYITSTYNTGWMNGDIKLATLSDTDDTDVTGSELVTNGTFDTDTSGWSAGNGATLSVASGQLRVNANGNNFGGAYQLITTEANKTYTLTVDVGAITNASDFYVLVRNTTISGTTLKAALVSANTSYAFTFTAISGTTAILFESNNDSDSIFDVDNISVRPAEEDRSVNGNGLQVFGTVTKNPVATGADLVAYSGFSSSNYLEQPYNPDLDFGTGDFCVMGWVKNWADSRYIFDRAGDDGSQRIYLYNTGGNIGTNFTPNYISVAPLDQDAWGMLTITRLSGVSYIYINGELKGSGANTTNIDGSSAKSKFKWGLRYNTNNALGQGSLALWRISATAPTAEQIAKIYESEKHLFTEGAQATLYGSSDAVTALAYDDTTDLLHVGTSAGRSDFSGLRRVSNTTDAVGTAISASNGMIVEE